MPVELHDGDDVLFGEASIVKVHITTAPVPGVAASYTVEQFLTDQCDALVQRLQVCDADAMSMAGKLTASCAPLKGDMEVQVNTLRAEADAAIAELQLAAAE